MDNSLPMREDYVDLIDQIKQQNSEIPVPVSEELNRIISEYMNVNMTRADFIDQLADISLYGNKK